MTRQLVCEEVGAVVERSQMCGLALKHGVSLLRIIAHPRVRNPSAGGRHIDRQSGLRGVPKHGEEMTNRSSNDEQMPGKVAVTDGVGFEADYSRGVSEAACQ